MNRIITIISVQSVSLWVVLCHFVTSSTIPTSDFSGKCGYSGCYLGEGDALNVHLVPHTHDDVGWLKTVDEYYFGLRNEFHPVKVEQILDSMVSALLENPQRRFIYVEMAYFHKWWRLHRNETLRDQVRQLVSQGRLQFVLGGWSMNDEVTTHYVDIIDQHTRGMRFLAQEFGECGTPLVAWQIDPFGHSREQANLFAQMGFDSLFIWRIDDQEKAHREKEKQLEMVWHSSTDETNDPSTLLTVVMDDGYFTPGGNCFDRIMCSGLYSPNPDIPRFLQYLRKKAAKFATNHILIPVGGDFQFQTSQDGFRLIDKFIEEINRQGDITSNTSQRRIHAFYSTPTCYTRALHSTNFSFPTKHDDFLPLMESSVTVWVGFYTTRPNLKRHVRVMSNLLQSAEQMAVVTGFAVESELEEQVDRLRQALGVLQHHDAITGTAKPHVASNYAVLLDEGGRACNLVLAYSLINSNLYKTEQSALRWTTCLHLNVSACEASEKGENFHLLLYSSSSHSESTFFRVPVHPTSAAKVRVFELKSGGQRNPVTFALHSLHPATLTVPERPRSVNNNADHVVDLVFPVRLPPLGYAMFEFSFTETPFTPPNAVWPSVQLTKGATAAEFIENRHYRLTVNPANGLIEGPFKLLASDASFPLLQEMCYYESHSGTNGNTDRSSGAYVFHPQNSEPVCMKSARTSISKSELVHEVHQQFEEPWLSQVIRVYRDSPFVEVEWTVGPLPSGKEVVLRYSTNWTSHGVFFTDSNCRQSISRRRDHRDGFPGFKQTAPVAGNYYPVNCFLGIPDCGKCENSGGSPKYRLAVVNDRAQGGSSIRDGQIELMVHRSTLADDGLGVESPLNELGADGKGLISRGKHWLLIAPNERFDGLLRSHAQQVYSEPVALFFSHDKTVSGEDALKKWRFPQFTALRYPLPSNVRILSLDKWVDDSFLLRLEHFYQRGEQPDSLGHAVVVRVDNLFSTFVISRLEELTLSANRDVSHLKTTRLRWWQSDGRANPHLTPLPRDEASWSNSTHISLQPMQIRTFRIWVHFIQ